MKFNTALANFIASVAVLFFVSSQPQKITKRIWLARGLSLLVFLIGLLTLCEYGFGWSLGIDELLVTDFRNLESSLFPGRMAPNAALSFLLMGLALFCVDKPGRSWRAHPSTILLLPTMLLSIFSLTGYIYGVKLFYQFGPFIRIAWQTTICLLVLSFAILFPAPAP